MIGGEGVGWRGGRDWLGYSDKILSLTQTNPYKRVYETVSICDKKVSRTNKCDNKFKLRARGRGVGWGVEGAEEGQLRRRRRFV